MGLVDRFERFDRWADGAFEPLRSQPIANPAFYVASALGDDGRLWLALCSAMVVRGPAERRRRGLELAAWLGIESALVNGPFKLAVRRERPLDHAHGHVHHLRTPATSSFPSGHAASGFTMATMLSEPGGATYLWFVPAVLVAASRVHVRVHHPSDVLGGVVAGTAIGLVARHLNVTGWLVDALFGPGDDPTPNPAADPQQIAG